MGKGARNYSLLTLKQLFGLSGNKCANCDTILISPRVMLAEICHIEAANAQGQRYNKSMTDKQRASFENLILLCPTCHKRTDDEVAYTVEVLKRMKADHESKHVTTKPSEEYIDIFLSRNAYDASFSEEEEWGILEEIVKFTLDNSSRNNLSPEAIKEAEIFINTKEKVKLNFPQDLHDRFSDMYIHTSSRRIAISDFLKRTSQEDSLKVDDLREAIILKYCSIKNSEIPSIEVNSIIVFDNLAKSLIPETKKDSPEYIAVAIALAIHYFESCSIGKKTKKEIKVQLSLFS